MTLNLHYCQAVVDWSEGVTALTENTHSLVPSLA